MKFDKSKVYTALNADEVKVGSKGYYADCLKDLEERVNSDNKTYYDTLVGIDPTSEVYRFKTGAACSSVYALFYLVEEPEKKKLRPYRDTDEMVDHFCRHFNLIPQDHRLPTLWIKNDYNKYLITRVNENTVTLCVENDVYTFSLSVLAEDYTWLDGSPCGIKED